MRFVNRRRLLIVAVLAALFGAALPYGVCVATQLCRNNDDGGETTSYPEFRGTTARHWRGPMRGGVTIGLRGGALADENWDWIVSQSGGLMPDDLRDVVARDSILFIDIREFGWPFRAAHMCIPLGHSLQLFPATRTRFDLWDTGRLCSDRRSPIHIPLGTRWAGLVGNVGLSVVFFAITYCGLASCRARHRFKRGQCWRCGYLSYGAAVCPECGAAVKA